MSRYNEIKIISVCLFDCMGFFFTLEIFNTHMETSPLPLKGCKF